MPKKVKKTDDRLLDIEVLIAALVLGRKPTTEQVSKIIGIRKAKLIKLLGKEEALG